MDLCVTPIRLGLLSTLTANQITDSKCASCKQIFYAYAYVAVRTSLKNCKCEPAIKKIRKWKIFHLLMLMLMLMLLCCVCVPVVHKHKHKHKYVCSFPVRGKHESRVQSRSTENAKMAAEFGEKPAEAVRKYTSLYNKKCPDFKDKSKRVISQDDLYERIHFSFLLLVLSLLFCFVVVK